jgi:glutathione peroxidase
VPDTSSRSVFDFFAEGIDGSRIPLSRFDGQVLLIVNVASRCGYTPQYRGLEWLYRRHRDEGFTVLGFPCNQFGHQEPGSNAEIQGFCSEAYDVTFPMFARIDVNGPDAIPLYRFLKTSRRGLLGSEAIKWNFTKFLIDRQGRPIRRFGPRTSPLAIEPVIVNSLRT